MSIEEMGTREKSALLGEIMGLECRFGNYFMHNNRAKFHFVDLYGRVDMPLWAYAQIMNWATFNIKGFQFYWEEIPENEYPAKPEQVSARELLDYLIDDILNAYETAGLVEVSDVR